MMQNYQLMRNILKKVAYEKRPLDLVDFSPYGTFEELQSELTCLKDEGLIEHTMSWSYGTFDGGSVSAITAEGLAFYRNIENEDVWAIIYRTLEAANLDLSYPLLKEVCETVVKRYVMGKIPKEL